MYLGWVFLLQSEVVLPDIIRSVNLTGWLHTCQEFHLDMIAKINGLSLKAKQETENGNGLLYPLDGAKKYYMKKRWERFQESDYFNFFRDLL